MPQRAELILGPARSGKTAWLVEPSAAAVGRRDTEEFPPLATALWLAPGGAAVGEIRDAVAGRLEAGVLAPAISTFGTFCEHVLAVAGSPLRRLTPLENRRLLETAVGEVRTAGRLQHFAAVAETPGFMAQAAEFIAEAARRGSSAEQFRQAAASPRERELGEILAAYQRQLSAARAYDPEGLIWEARAVLKQRRDLLAGLRIAVAAGFNDFTSAQLEILQLAAQAAEATFVELTLDRATVGGATDDAAAGDGEPAGASGRPDLFARSLVTRLMLRRRIPLGDHWFPNGGEVGKEKADEENTGSGAFAQISQSLFSLETPAGGATDAVQVIAAPSERREATAVAAKVKRLLLAGTPPSEIVVATRTIDDFASRLADTFADYVIPVWCEARPAWGTTPLARVLAAVLTVRAEDWKYRPLLAFVGHNLLSWRPGGFASAEQRHAVRTSVELAIRTAQVAAGRESLLATVRQWGSAHDEALAAGETTHDEVARRGNIAHRALPALEWLADCLAKLPARATVAEWIAALETTLRALGLLAHRGPNWLAWLALRSSLLEIQRADALAPTTESAPAAELDLPALRTLVGTIGSQTPAPLRADATGCVRIVGAERARHQRPRHLLIAGLSEQSFPAPVREDRLAAQRRFDELVEADEQGFGDDGELAVAAAADASPTAGEMLLFYQLVTRPVESLTLSYPALDAKAQTLPPSPYLTELVRCFPEGVRRQEIALHETDEGGPQDALSATEYRRRTVAAAVAGVAGPLATLARSVEYAEVGMAMLGGLEAVAARSGREVFGPCEGVLGSDAARAAFTSRFAGDHLWSPSQLELYALCPFRFYAEKGLGLSPAPDLILESDFARRGVVFHDTLATLFRRRGSDEVEQAAAKLDDAARGELREELVAGYRAALTEATRHAPRGALESALYEIERRQIEAWAEKLAEQELNYRGAYESWDAPPRPAYFEARFGKGSRRSDSAADAQLSVDAPYELALPKEKILLTGQIDRIDVGQVGGRTAFNVIDYKSSASAGVAPEKIADGRQLQLPLYAMAAEELLLAHLDAIVWTAGYWNIAKSGLGSLGRKGGPLQLARLAAGGVEADPDWDAIRTGLRQRVAEIVAGIRAAEFPVFSADDHCTSRCDYRTTCRIAQVRSLRKSWHGTTMASETDGNEEEV